MSLPRSEALQRDTMCLRVSTIWLSIPPRSFDLSTPPLSFVDTQRLTGVLETRSCSMAPHDWLPNCTSLSGTKATVRPHRVCVSLEKPRECCSRRGNRPGQLEKESLKTKSILARRSTSFCVGSLTRHAENAPHDSTRLSILRFNRARHRAHW